MAGFKLEGGRKDGVAKRICQAAVSTPVGQAVSELREPSNKNHEQYYNVLRSLELGDWAEALSDEAVPKPVWGRTEGPALSGLVRILTQCDKKTLTDLREWLNKALK